MKRYSNAVIQAYLQYRHSGASRNRVVSLPCLYQLPAFTGMTAGVGLSGDLRNPGRSIPLGVIAATLAGFAIYLAVVAALALAWRDD